MREKEINVEERKEHCVEGERQRKSVREKVKVNEGEKVGKVEGNCGYKDERKGRRENE